MDLPKKQVFELIKQKANFYLKQENYELALVEYEKTISIYVYLVADTKNVKAENQSLVYSV